MRALQLARESAGLFDGQTLLMLEMAADRMLFKLERYSEMRQLLGNGCLPLQKNDYAKALEYYLIMGVLKKKETW